MKLFCLPLLSFWHEHVSYHLVFFKMICFLAIKHLTMWPWCNLHHLPSMANTNIDSQVSPSVNGFSVSVPKFLMMFLRAIITGGVIVPKGASFLVLSIVACVCMCTCSFVLFVSLLVQAYLGYQTKLIFTYMCWTVDVGLKARLLHQERRVQILAQLLTGCVDLSKVFNCPEFQLFKRKMISTSGVIMRTN